MTVKDWRPDSNCDKEATGYDRTDPDTWKPTSAAASSLCLRVVLNSCPPTPPSPPLLLDRPESKRGPVSLGSVRFECVKRHARGEQEKSSVKRHHEVFSVQEEANLTSSQIRQQHLVGLAKIKEAGGRKRRDAKVCLFSLSLSFFFFVFSCCSPLFALRPLSIRPAGGLGCCTASFCLMQGYVLGESLQRWLC